MAVLSAGRARAGLNLLAWSLPFLGLLIGAGLWVMVLLSLAAERAQAESDIEQRIRGQTQAFEEYTRRALQQIDQITAFVALDFSVHGQASDAAGSPALARLLALGLGEVPGVAGLYVADAQGQVLNSTLPMAQRQVGEQADFMVHGAARSAGLFIGRPEPGQGSHAWLMPLTRRLQHADGRFAGVIAVLMDPHYFTDFYRASQLGQEGVVSLVGLDWVVRARRSGERLWFGETAGNNFLVHELKRWPEGSYVAGSKLDGITRRLAYKTLEGYPLVAFTGLGLDEAMTPYRERRTRTLGFAALASVALLLAFGGLSVAAFSLRRTLASREQARAQFEAASDASLDAFCILRAERDASGRVLDFRFTHCNERCAALIRQPKEQIIGRLRTEVFGADIDPRFAALYEEVLRTREPRQAEFSINYPSGSDALLCLRHQIVPVGDSVAQTSHDLSEERAREHAMRAAQEALQAAEKRLQAIANNLPVLIGYLDARERVQFVNATFRSWLGQEPEAVMGRTLAEALEPALYAQRQPWLRRALAGERVSFELESTALGVTRSLRNDYIPDIGEGGQVLGIYTLSQDISALKAVQHELSQLARRDSLTGLANRYQFNELLPRALARAARSGDALALLYLDVDRFKSINDSLGHGVGDAVLKEFAQRLLLCVRSTDTVARLAGDEFVIVLEGLGSEAEPQFIARKITSAVGRPIELQSLCLRVSTSIGIAFHAGGPVTPAALLQRADQALYQAKEGGRNTYRLLRA